MAKAVCNASPIIGLSIIGKIGLLWQIFDEVFIPEEVYNEVVSNNKYKILKYTNLVKYSSL